MRSRLLAFVLICLAISSYLQLSQPISCYLPLSLPSLSHLSDMSDYLQPTKTISSFFKPTHAISSHLSLFLATSGHLQQFQSIFIYLSMLLFLDLEIHFNVHSTFSSILGPCLQFSQAPDFILMPGSRGKYHTSQPLGRLKDPHRSAIFIMFV